MTSDDSGVLSEKTEIIFIIIIILLRKDKRATDDVDFRERGYYFMPEGGASYSILFSFVVIVDENKSLFSFEIARFLFC